MIEMKQDTISLKKRFDKFIVRCEVKSLSDMTIQYYQDVFNFFKTFLNSIKDKENRSSQIEAISITKETVDNYILAMKKSNIKDSTI